MYQKGDLVRFAYDKREDGSFKHYEVIRVAKDGSFADVILNYNLKTNKPIVKRIPNPDDNLRLVSR